MTRFKKKHKNAPKTEKLIIDFAVLGAFAYFNVFMWYLSKPQVFGGPKN